jgi:hypothetical protein
MVAPLGVLLAAEPAGAQPKFADPAPAPITQITHATPAPNPVSGFYVDLPSEDTRKLSLYGFADFNYLHMLLEADNPWRQILFGSNAFSVGNLHLYVDGEMSERWRTLMEVRFLYVPNGVDDARPDGSLSLTDTSVRDPTEFGRIIQWGGIVIERAWMEYRAHDLLTLRGGHFLTPYGIWNVDHGSPTVVGITRPFIVHAQLFPEHQSGIEIYGAGHVRNFKLGYHLTLSNGRGLFDTYIDQDDDKALGGRFYVERRGALDARVGLSFYRSRSTERSYSLSLTGNTPGSGPIARRHDSIKSQFDALSLGADLRVRWRGLLVQGEALLDDRAYTDEGRERGPNPNTSMPDLRRWGVYLLAGYRTPFFQVMPYVTGEFFRQENPVRFDVTTGPMPNFLVGYAGLNIRPMADVVFKVEYFHATFPGSRPGSWGHSDWRGLRLQMAWAF